MANAIAVCLYCTIKLGDVAAPRATTFTFTFDAADRLAGVSMPDTTQVAFGYDADGQRVSQTADGQSTDYLWDAYSAYDDVVLETDGSGGTPLAAYTLANGQLIAQTRGGVPTYYLSDGQGSTRALANASGAITDTYDSDDREDTAIVLQRLVHLGISKPVDLTPSSPIWRGGG